MREKLKCISIVHCIDFPCRESYTAVSYATRYEGRGVKCIILPLTCDTLWVLLAMTHFFLCSYRTRRFINWVEVVGGPRGALKWKSFIEDDCCCTDWNASLTAGIRFIKGTVPCCRLLQLVDGILVKRQLLAGVYMWAWLPDETAIMCSDWMLLWIK